jgi:hypothetical protein
VEVVLVDVPVVLVVLLTVLVVLVFELYVVVLLLLLVELFFLQAVPISNADTLIASKKLKYCRFFMISVFNINIE